MRALRSQLLAWLPALIAAQTTYQVSGGSFSSPFWTFSPSLPSAFTAGETYRFEANGISSIHPFRIGMARNDESATWITRSGAMTGSTGSVDMVVPSGYAGTITYWCNVHGSMTRTLSVTGQTFAVVIAASPSPSPPPPSPSPPPPSPSPCAPPTAPPPSSPPVGPLPMTPPPATPTPPAMPPSPSSPDAEDASPTLTILTATVLGLTILVSSIAMATLCARRSPRPAPVPVVRDDGFAPLRAPRGPSPPPSAPLFHKLQPPRPKRVQPAVLTVTVASLGGSNRIDAANAARDRGRCRAPW